MGALHLMRGYLTNRALRRQSMALGLVVACCVAILTLVTSTSLTGSQQVQRTLGSFGNTISVPINLTPARTTDSDRIVADVAHMPGVRDAAVTLGTSDVVVGNVTPDKVQFLETDVAWPEFQRYHLTSGRWPQSPGEVVTSSSFPLTGPRVTAFGGQVALTVVGHYADSYARHTSGMLAAAGTWHLFATPAIARNYPTAMAATQVFWTGGDTARILDKVSARVVSVQKNLTDGDLQGMRQSLVTRNDLAARSMSSVATRTPAVFTIPALGLVLAAAALGATVSGRWAQRTAERLARIGISRPTLVVATTGSLLVANTIAMLIAAPAGFLVALLLRPLLGRQLDGPLSPPWFPLHFVAQALLLAVALATAISLLLSTHRGDPTTRSHQFAARMASPTMRTFARRIVSRPVRRLTLLGAVLALVMSHPDTPSRDHLGAAMLLSGVCAAALIPEVFTILARLRRDSTAFELAKRLLLRDHWRTLLLAGALAVVLGTPLSVAVSTDSFNANDQANRFGTVPIGTARLQEPNHGIVPANVLYKVQHTVNSSPTAYTEAISPHTNDVTVVTGHDGLIAVMDKPGDVEQILGTHLDQHQRDILTRGLLTTGWDPHGHITLETDKADGTTTTAGTHPATSVITPRELAAHWAAITLRSTATSLHMPTGNPAYLFTHLDNTQQKAITQTSAHLGFDTNLLNVGASVEKTQVALSVRIVLYGLALAILAILTIFTRTYVQVLEKYLSRIITIGLPRRWATTVLGWQINGLILTAIPAALILAWLPDIWMVANTWTTSNPATFFPLGMPGQYCTLVAASLALGTTLALALAHQTLTRRKN